MLNKKDILEIMKALKLPAEEYWISAGAGLVMHGIKKETRDIDMGCTTKLMDVLAAEGHKLKDRTENARGLILNEAVEIFENWQVDVIEWIEGFPVASLESIKKQKQALGREKDFVDIELINAFQKKIKTI